MKKIYFDNASTTFPKPSSVPEAMYEYMTQIGCNINRGCYESAYKTEEYVYETRQELCDLFHGQDSRNVVFTKNVTESLNILLKGFLKAGDHVITSSMEHNAVMRPLVQLEKMGIEFSRVPCRCDGTLPAEDLSSFIKPNTKAVVMTHASNVCGTLLPVQEIGSFCKAKGIRFFVDAAQTGGVYPFNMEEMNIDGLAFTGHKGLLGPQGIGGFILRPDLCASIEPLLSGGTGSISHTEEIPDFMPDRFESGTMNIPGIVGLRAALLWLKDTEIDVVREHELSLTDYFLSGLRRLDGNGEHIRIIGKEGTAGRTGVVSLQTIHQDLAQVAWELDDTYGIMTRVGLHCAPSAHKTLGTYPTGTIRFSFGWWNTTEEIDSALNAMDAILER